MSITKLGKVLTLLASSTLLFACASKEIEEATPVDTTPQDTTEQVIEDTRTPDQIALEDNAALRARLGNNVYFDLDEDTVKPEGRELLEAHAWFLARSENANKMITVEGHCDERGTPAYNLALGERRAKAVAQILMLNGVSASQIKTVSHGEEKPAAMGHDESAWSQNRRGVLAYEG